MPLSLSLGRCHRGDALRLGLRNLYILPTRFGWLWLGGIVLLLLVSIQMQQNGPLLLGLLLLAVFVLTLHLTHFNLQGLDLRCDAPPPAFAAAAAVYPLRLRVPGRCEGLRLRFDGQEPGPALSLPPGEHRLPVPWIPAQRGWQQPGRLRLHTTAPLGLFRCWTCWQPGVAQLIYPAPVPGPVVSASGNPEQEEAELPRTGRAEGSDEWVDLRPHRPEEPASRLAWKLLARGRGRHSKRFAAAAMDPPLLAAPPDLPFEQGLSHLCDRICRLHERGESYGLLLPGRCIPPDRGRAQRDRCLAALALAS